MRNSQCIHNYLMDTYKLNESEVLDIITNLDLFIHYPNYILDGYSMIYNESINLNELVPILESNQGYFINIFTDDEFLIVNLSTKKIYTKKFKLLNSGIYDTTGLSNDEVILFKLKPISAQQNHIDRAKKKGLRDVAPSFDDIISRAESTKDGKAFKSLLRNPCLAYSIDDNGTVRNFQIGNRSNGKLHNFYYLPKVRLVKDRFHNEAIPIFVLYDHINRSQLGIKNYALVLGALVGKSQSFSIDDKLLKRLWDNSLNILFSSLYTYSINIDYIVVPSSMGKLISYYRDSFKTYSPKTKIITIKKPTITQLEDFYEKHKSKYKKIFDTDVIASYVAKGNKDQINPATPFKMENGEYYPNILYVPDSEYEKRKDLTIKISKLPTSVHRNLITTMMSDYIIESGEIPKEISGNVILFDDDVTTGSTLINFLYSTVKRSSKSIKNIYVMSMLTSSDNSLTDKGKFGIDKSITSYKTKNRTKLDEIMNRFNYILSNLSNFDMMSFSEELESFSYMSFKVKLDIKFDTKFSIKEVSPNNLEVLLPTNNESVQVMKDVFIKLYEFLVNRFSNSSEKLILLNLVKGVDE